MRSKFKWIFTLILALTVQFSFAQEKTITGTVTDATGPLPGVNVVVKGTTRGVQTGFDGNYSIKAKEGEILVFSFLGMNETSRTVGASNTVNVVLQEGANQLTEVVVTAMGIKKEKKALGYASQEVKGADIADTPVTNFADALSGEVAGLNIQSSGTMGGSSNIQVRGFNSISGNNQALIIIDGTPVLNETNNSADQRTGRGGYDYGNAASDINPDDIESLNVLKGAAATALYGSRGANGVIIITTKKGKKSDTIGVSVSTALTAGNVDKETLPKYQNKYGAGYGRFYGADEDQYFNDQFDVNGDGINDLSVPFGEDASYGGAFDPNLLVYQWNSLYPELPTYHQATPWVGARNNPNSIFETALATNNNVSFGKSTETSSFRVGFTNRIQNGVMPNSSIKKNTLTFSGSQDLSSKLKISTDFSYTNTKGKGRNGTGYDSRNPMQAFRQWWQTNVDIMDQKNAFFNTGKNVTWNVTNYDDTSPLYTDNVWWTLFKNYQNDSRDRFLGNFTLNQKVTNWFNVMGRFSYDTYTEIREERVEVGSVDVSDYTVTQRKASEYNYDLIGTFNFNITENLKFDGLAGFNMRVNKLNSLAMSTNGGLNTPGLFTIANSANPLTSDDYAKNDINKKVDGLYAKAGINFKDTFYLDGTIRTDRSASLPKENNRYYYPSVTTSFIFSNLLKQDWLTFGKIRANYAEVGNDTDLYQVYNTYDINPGFGGSSSASNPGFFNNPKLLPETSKDYEFGLEMQFFNRRFGFDVSYYNRKTIDLITPLAVSTATGATNLWLNGADLENKGIEAMVNATPIKMKDFSWDIKVNFAKNENEVTRLAEGVEFIQLAAVQGGVTLGAQLGEAFGVIRGRDFVYLNGQKVVQPNGYYLRTAGSNEVIGNIQPDWTGGVKNNFKYKNINLGFLIDVQKGGDVFSLDTYYGYATGLYDFTAGNNHLGNPVRDAVSNGGGVILPGVQADGTPNTVVANATTYANPWGYARTPQAAHVYDASFVKLREVSLTYNFSKSIAESLHLSNLSFSLLGRNLWIIHKNTPYTDPEAGLSAGNIQGYQSGAYPSVREIGGSLKFEF
ncbi:SusC/RagA family TonB-linked outer membrane protein [Flavobacterium sp. H122]|uniref:SusC/RagA family TonB-linked outer membrane protein n=1 Tax=Flavobacterium sp. H122 TaxID=2529860 RepID=UPI0010A9C915|nr:SusC/RagA family TonB-linked outer membrane protein [Flavobacterium sp. H122]